LPRQPFQLRLTISAPVFWRRHGSGGGTALQKNARMPQNQRDTSKYMILVWL
jgi:hypothetical protein